MAAHPGLPGAVGKCVPCGLCLGRRASCAADCLGQRVRRQVEVGGHRKVFRYRQWRAVAAPPRPGADGEEAAWLAAKRVEPKLHALGTRTAAAAHRLSYVEAADGTRAGSAREAPPGTENHEADRVGWTAGSPDGFGGPWVLCSSGRVLDVPSGLLYYPCDRGLLGGRRGLAGFEEVRDGLIRGEAGDADLSRCQSKRALFFRARVRPFCHVPLCIYHRMDRV